MARADHIGQSGDATRAQRCVFSPSLITSDDFKPGEPPKRPLWARRLALLRFGLQLERYLIPWANR